MPNDRPCRKRFVKQLKKDIVRDGALEIGYAYSIFNEIDGSYIISAIVELAKYGADFLSMPREILDSYVLTEVIRLMSYQEFKQLIHYFFRRDNKND